MGLPGFLDYRPLLVVVSFVLLFFFFSLSLFSCFLSVGVYVAGSLVFVFADEVVLPGSF